MRSCGLDRPSLPTLAALVMMFVLMVVLPQWAEAVPSDRGIAEPEPVVILLGAALLERRLAAFVEIRPGHFLASREIQAACLRPAVRADSVLLFFPETKTCDQLGPAGRLELGNRLHAITGVRPPTDLWVRLRQQQLLPLAPRLRAQSLAVRGCTCAGNDPPVGMVACEVQSRTQGAPIAAIDYLASDPDGDVLSGVFTHQLGIDPVQNGLPASLTSTCNADPGSLQCTIIGSAPDQPGDLLLMLAVSDGTVTLDLVSVLEVTAAGGELLFIDQFEALVCP